MGTTPKYAIPYIESSDRIADYPISDKAQADRLEAIFATPIASQYHLTAGNISIPAGTDTVINFNQAGPIVDAVNLPYSAGTWTIKVAGVYLIIASAFFEKTSSGTNRIFTSIYVNGVSAGQQVDNNDTTGFRTLPVTLIKLLAVNDTIKVMVRGDQAAQINANSMNWLTSCNIYRLN